MGLDQRKKGPPLPAPTETDSTTAGTEVDSRLDSFSVPDDGSPITVATRRKKPKDGESQSSGSHNRSQTSFLIDFFEGGKSQQDPSRRPSVRVKVTPSSKSRSRSAHDHIQISEKKGNRKPSYTKRITLSPKPAAEADDTSSIRSAAEESNVTDRSAGVEVEIMGRQGSPRVVADRHSKYNAAHASDISSMPTDSFLDGKPGTPERKRSRSTGEALLNGVATGLAVGEAVHGKSPSRRRSRSLSRERILVQKATEKVRSDREKSERRRRHRSRSRSASAELVTEGARTPRRRSSRVNNDDAVLSGPDSSAFKSQVSAKSGGEQSVRSSTTSKSSINNPKLLETVEDAIRRLILPELSQLRREQSKHSQREAERKRSGSLTKGSSHDESVKSRRSSGRHSENSSTPTAASAATPKEKGAELTTQSPRPRKEKRAKRVTQLDAAKSFEREGSEETVTKDVSVTPRKNGLGHAAEKVATAAAVTALTEHALQEHHSRESLEEKKRRRRRNKVRSQGDSTETSEVVKDATPAAPMPLMSEINASEITRTSILSADTERPNSISMDSPRMTPTKEVPRGIASPASRTPTRTPAAAQQGLGTLHSNASRGNLSLHSQSSEHQLNQPGSPSLQHSAASPMSDHDDVYVADHDYVSGVPAVINGVVQPGTRILHHHHNHFAHAGEDMTPEEFGFYQANQIVPPPLKYIPYAETRRGLSPIQSVSGYTEGDPDIQRRQSRSIHSAASHSSLAQSQRPRDSARSMKSLDSFADIRNRHDFAEVRQGGLTDSELTQDGEFWEEHQKENNRLRASDHVSTHEASTKRISTYTDGSADVPSGRNVTNLAQNPVVHTPLGVESAVASLINESELTGYSARQEASPRKASYAASYDEDSEQQFSSRGSSPIKHGSTTHHRDSLADYEGEYELDENGRKVTMPNFRKPVAKKGAIAAIVSGAAAVVMGKSKRARQASISNSEKVESPDSTPQKTFKQRALETQIPMSPKHSIDKLSESASFEQPKMSASGFPDAKHPMPEIGYAEESDVSTTPSLAKERHMVDSGNSPRVVREEASAKRMSTAPSPKDLLALKAAESVLLGAAASAGEAAALSHHQRQAGQEQEHVDEWRRSSAERKRDTLVTNPYEGTSPIAALGIGLDNDVLGQPPFHNDNADYDSSRFRAAGSPGALPKDEGYISAANNARSTGAITPDVHAKAATYRQAKDLGHADINDPFYTGRDPTKLRHHLSGLSQGMGSPVYDSATGYGMDRIQSKDIVALMDHLTVRDAQRSARDTEILVTLVRAAAEMRNSFEDMKKLLADTEDVIITEVQQNTDKSVQKAINGPRPQPQSAPRSLRQGSHDDMYDDLPAKKRNVFRKALKGLSMRSNNDLGKIEDMLVQLLGDVEGLKGAQLNASQQGGASYDDLRAEGASEQDRGYEAEGGAGTSTASHGSQSGHFSLPRSQTNTSRGYDARKFSDHRISTVHEGDEDEPIPLVQEHVLDNDFDRDDGLLTPTQEVQRGGSAPLGTPPQQYIPPASASNDNTPTTDKSKKSKSGTMGWIPKVKRWSGNSTPKVSRWSETTASTVLKGFRSSNRSSHRNGDDHMPSRSGSEVGEFAGREIDHDPYGDDKLHSGFSREDVDMPDGTLENHSMLPQEDPKYKAHRNSLNLQHPQPRPHATVRYQTALESQAQQFHSPRSPASVDFGSQVSLHQLSHARAHYSDGESNHSGHMSPAPGSDGGYSNASAAEQISQPGPPRPPKIPEVPLKPRQQTRIQKPSPLSTEHLIADEDVYGAASSHDPGSPRTSTHMRALSGNMAVPTRKPTGPRSMASASPRSDPAEGRRNVNRDTFGTINSGVSGESETF